MAESTYDSGPNNGAVKRRSRVCSDGMSTPAARRTESLCRRSTHTFHPRICKCPHVQSARNRFPFSIGTSSVEAVLHASRSIHARLTASLRIRVHNAGVGRSMRQLLRHLRTYKRKRVQFPRRLRPDCLSLVVLIVVAPISNSIAKVRLRCPRPRGGWDANR